MKRSSSTKLSPFIRLLLFAGYPLLILFLFYAIGTKTFTIFDYLAIIVISLFLSFATASFLRNPNQFLVACFEVVRYLFGLILSLIVRVINFIRRIIYVSFKSIILLIILIIYWISPVDIIPDPLLPFGILDDAGFTYWFYLRVANLAANMELKRTARDVLENTRIRTPFP